MEGRTFERELPEGYEAALTIDAGNKKFGLLLNLVALLPMIPAVIAVVAVLRGSLDEVFQSGHFMGKWLGFLAAMLAYIVLHELTHGAAYYALTRRKLTFGLKLTCAYCGVPDIYTYRRTALISLLAPFTVFTVVFGLLSLFLTDPLLRAFAILLLGLHVGGCSGDLYDTLLFLTRFRDPATLMRDTGPAQTIYRKKHTAA